jgi:hypothetical protein
MKACSFSGCPFEHHARGLCSGHWQQQKRGAELRPIDLSNRVRRRKPPEIVPHPSDPSLALVPLTMGYFAVISAVDVPEVGRFNWHAKPSGGTVYARRTTRDDSAKEERWLHRFIGAQCGLTLTGRIDHENRNGLDCRRSNLRDATASQNCQNSVGMGNPNRLGVRGVVWDERRQKYRAYAKVDGKQEHLGRYDTLEEAEDAAKMGRERLHGMFANHAAN